MSACDIRIAIRADASAGIGLGHVKRCLSLASALRALGAKPLLLTRDLGVDTNELCSAANIECSLLQPLGGVASCGELNDVEYAKNSWKQDADECVRTLVRWRPHWVIVDHYGFDFRWHDRIAKKLSARIGVIDDLGDRVLSAELLVDQNLADNHREKYFQRIPRSATLLGGPSFALLSSAYSRATPIRISEKVRRIGICMGGADTGNFTPRALRACREHAGFDGTIEIAVTKAYSHRHDLDALVEQWPDTSVVSDLNDLVDFYGHSDLQIGAGGSASWERCCLGVPTLAFVTAPNQKSVLPQLEKLGAVAVVPEEHTHNEPEIGAQIRSLITNFEQRVRMSARGRELVDGLGSRRVSVALGADWLSVRPATLEDSKLIFEWRNHPKVREVSHNGRKIEWNTHQQWMAESLLSQHRRLLVAHVGSENVGVVRFDDKSQGQFEVSLYLDPALHGLKLGRAMLSAGESYVLRNAQFPQEFVAMVLADNRRSIQLFESSGYKLIAGIWKKTVDRSRLEEATDL